MLPMYRFISPLVFSFCIWLAHAQAFIKPGKVYDAHTQKPIENVSLINTFTEESFITDSTGDFKLHVEIGHLVDVRKLG